MKITKKNKILVGISLLVLLTGLTVYFSMSKSLTNKENTQIGSRDLASRFALYYVSEKLATPASSRFLMEGNITDTGVSSTSATWKLTPEPGGVLACIIVTPTDKASTSQPVLVAMFDLLSNNSIGSGRLEFGENGVSTCEEAKQKLTKYDVTKGIPALDFLNKVNNQNLSPYTLTDKGNLSYSDFVKNGNFFKSQSAIDLSSVAQIEKMAIFVNKALKTKSLIGNSTDGWQLSVGKLTNSKTNATIEIPLSMNVTYDGNKNSYCISLNGWGLDSKNTTPSKSICNIDVVQKTLFADSLAVGKVIKSLIPKAGSYNYAKIKVSQDGIISLIPTNKSVEKVTISKKILLPPGFKVLTQGYINSKGEWCLEASNLTLKVIFNQNYVIYGVIECPILSEAP